MASCFVWSARALVAAVVTSGVGCGGDEESPGASSSSSMSSSTGGGTGQIGNPSEPDFADCGGAIFDADGKLVPDEYRRQATLWDRPTIDCRLGPSFDALNPGAADDRPEAYEPPHQPNPDGYLCKTFELSGTCASNCDYGSTAGQVLYAPDDAADPGVDRVQTYGYEAGHICESPQAGDWLGGPHPDPALVQWAGELGEPVAMPNGFGQTEMWETNGGIMIFPMGLVGATGNQTSGGSNPRTALPENKVPTAVAVTLYNELALITVWDTKALRAQVAVFALRADSPGAFSVPYFALPNEAGFKNIQLLGFVDLPDMVTPTAISANGNNGATPGGHAIGNEFGGDKMDDPAVRQAFARDDYERWVPTMGQAVVISRWEGKATFLDLTPLFQFVRSVYFGTDADWQKAKAQDVWPYSFETNPEMIPTVVATVALPKPTAARVANMPAGNEQGLRQPLKAWIADLDGAVHLYDLSGFAAEARPVPADSVKELAQVTAGANVTSLSLVNAHGWSNGAVVASRGDRSIQWLAVDEDSVDVARTLHDKRMDDPVRVDVNDRGPVVTAADFHGKKLVTFRFGTTEDNGGKPPANYGCGDGGADATCATFELGGTFAVQGMPFFLGTTNVN